MSAESLAFFTGLFGSLHCFLMCGPLVMSLPFGDNALLGFFKKLIYQFGRIITYAFLGYISGLIGKGLNILGMQQTLSIVSGILLIGIAAMHFYRRTAVTTPKIYTKFIVPIASQMGKFISKPYGSFFAGILHGLLPCGMVYLALTASLNAGSAFAGAQFMLFFGLGTVPLLLGASLLPLFIRKARILRFATPFMFLIAGAFLLIRGLNLNMPYLHHTAVAGHQHQSLICK